jgi:glycosyltransferase involved in cell wall biosynthesis
VPRVAVAIPAYNAAATLGAAIDSVLGQTYRDLALTVVDDGSTDETVSVARSRGDRVRVLEAAHGGVSRARNAGVAGADSELVAFLDADDLWEPEKLERQVQALDARPDAGMCFTAVTRVDGDLRPLAVTAAEERADFCRDLLLHSSVVPAAPSAALIRRSMFDEVGRFDPRFSQCADWDILLRLSLVTKFAALDEPLVRYRQAPGNMSSDIRHLERDTFAVLDAFYAEPRPAEHVAIRRRVYSNHWLIVSGSYLHQGRWKDAARCLRRALVADPTNLGRPAGLPLRWARRLGGRGTRA